MKVIASAFVPGETPYKWIDFPQPNYASTSADCVLHEGKMVGMSMFNGYSYNERAMLSLGVVDSTVEEGDILTLQWGEPEPTGKTSHRATPSSGDSRASFPDAVLPNCSRRIRR